MTEEFDALLASGIIVEGMVAFSGYAHATIRLLVEKALRG